MRTSPAPADTLPTSPSETWLEVRRGQTRAPRRDIRGRRFLIGAGSNCQLQLGGADVPILHSILLIEDEGAHIDAVVATPQLLVNGRPQRSADLHDGDVFSIGKFEFAVHVPLPTAAVQSAPRVEIPVPESAAELSRLSAMELVALIESEQAQIDDMEESCRVGVRAMVEAAQLAAAASAETSAAPQFVITFPQVVATSNDAGPTTDAETVAITARRAS